jgi:hypothetical protein
VGRSGTQYVLRRRDRFGFWVAIFLFAFSAALLTVAAVSVATVLRDRAAIVGQVLMAVGDAGIYLTERSQCIPWPEVAGLVVFRTWQDGDDSDSGTWLSRMAVVSSGEDFQPRAGAWGVTVDLHGEKVRLGELSDAVHTYAPGLPVWDAGKIK